MKEHYNPSTMHFAYTANQPDLTEVTVKEALPGTLFGVPAVFLIIGNSHFVTAPALQYSEICSCVPPQGEVLRTINLIEEDVAEKVSFTTPGVAGATRIETQPLEKFPAIESHDLTHEFGKDAYTTINVQSGGYETYHTYPEYDQLVYTHTVVERRREPGVGVSERPDSPVTLPTPAFDNNG